MTLNPINITLLTLSLVASAAVFANPPGGKPPQEAIDACASSSENSQVSFETPRGDTLEATCKMIDGELVAVPDNAPDDMKQPPKKRS
ncbi:hypothetical protein [Shewanella litoralis]|uniref:DUF333 domain-containing protein n=1 Tax=Shewanella litoralis TaxID=2282700 RepID=A0ABQ2RB00_9GAMM|nr:hypothetical protein [Shewanella litoralis]GGQ18824.1 hypothetical protein GCM10009411_18800 [Shewanella litoralis]